MAFVRDILRAQGFGGFGIVPGIIKFKPPPSIEEPRIIKFKPPPKRRFFKQRYLKWEEPRIIKFKPPPVEEPILFKPPPPPPPIVKFLPPPIVGPGVVGPGYDFYIY